MKRGSVLRYLLIPTLVGLLATWLVYRYVAPQQAVAEVTMVDVAVARQSLPPRMVLSTDDLAMKPFPKDYLPQGAITSLDEAVGKVTTSPLAEGEVVLASHLADASSKVALAYHVPPGHRAITVKVDEVTGVAGFVQPGDHVDVVLILDADKVQDSGGSPEALLLLQDVAVLAVGQHQDSNPQASSGSLEGYTSLTLALTPEDVLQLSLGSYEGSLRAVLRPAVAEAPVKIGVVRDGDLTGR